MFFSNLKVAFFLDKILSWGPVGTAMLNWKYQWGPGTCLLQRCCVGWGNCGQDRCGENDPHTAPPCSYLPWPANNNSCRFLPAAAVTWCPWRSNTANFHGNDKWLFTAFGGKIQFALTAETGLVGSCSSSWGDACAVSQFASCLKERGAKR